LGSPEQLALDHAAQEGGHADLLAPRGLPRRTVLLLAEVDLRANHCVMLV
jgi:hypothetical protein